MHVTRELRDEKLDFWIQHNLNVLLIGHYGVGKTARILEAFKRNNINYKYFSASTMDPWCDFIGVPKVMQDDNGAYLDYVLPRDLRDDTIEAIYLDEFNRSHKKVRNAVMELLQFKSINGRKFNKLRMIWTAINPEEEGDYQVEALDKVQKDRFQVQIAIPYEPSVAYFESQFGIKQSKTAISWWQSLTPEQQMEVSPRRLEYALQMYNLPGGNIKDVLPYSSNPAQLAALLKAGPIDDRMKQMLDSNDLVTASKFFQVENNYTSAAQFVVDRIPVEVNTHDWKLFFLQAIPSEKLSSLISTSEIVFKFVVENQVVPTFAKVITNIINTNTDKNLVRRIKKEIDSNKLVMATISQVPNSKSEKPYFSNRISNIKWESLLTKWLSLPLDTTLQRVKIYEELINWIPKTLTMKDAVDTLEIISMLADRSHVDTIKQQFRHLIGVVNHCIDQINKASSLSWNEILTNYGSKFDKLMAKIRLAGLDSKIYCPLKKAT